MEPPRPLQTLPRRACRTPHADAHSSLLERRRFCPRHRAGPVEVDYVEEVYSFSRFPLSAACAVSKLTNAYERHWNIL